MNRCYINYNNFRHKCRLNVNSPSKCKSCIMCVRLKRPDIPIRMILIKLTKYTRVLIYIKEDKWLLFFFIFNKTNGIILF